MTGRLPVFAGGNTDVDIGAPLSGKFTQTGGRERATAKPARPHG
jgi:hypothetical protein